MPQCLWDDPRCAWKAGGPAIGLAKMVVCPGARRNSESAPLSRALSDGAEELCMWMRGETEFAAAHHCLLFAESPLYRDLWGCCC
eukprot:15410366-Alexandrium_andersonii.AAC.1